MPRSLASRPTTSRATCVYREGGLRCTARGTGKPPLCRDHEELATNPIDDVFDRLEDFSARAQDRAFKGLGTLIITLVDRQRQPRPVPGQAGQAPRRPPEAPPQENPRDVLGFGAEIKLTHKLIKERKRALAALCHPDKGGSTKAMQRIIDAANKLLAETKA